jgi:hypothetical protein
MSCEAEAGRFDGLAYGSEVTAGRSHTTAQA